MCFIIFQESQRILSAVGDKKQRFFGSTKTSNIL